MTDFPASLTAPRSGCQGCTGSPELPFSFEYAYQPIVDMRDQSVFAHEALVRGPNGEGALSVLNQVTDQNRYRFDQQCRVRAIAGEYRTSTNTGGRELFRIANWITTQWDDVTEL